MTDPAGLDRALKGTDFFTAAPMPRAAVLEEPLAHNLAFFQAYCRGLGAELAPHVKTTMSRWILDRQLEAGAWGATVANAPQAHVVRGWGAHRLLIAAQLTDPASLAWFAGEADRGGETYCWVDSVAGVELLAEAHRRADATAPARVLIEIGYLGGRTGCRGRQAALEVASAIARHPAVELHGISAFEGTVAAESKEATYDAIRGFLRETGAIAQELRHSGAFATESGDPILTAGGSAYFDVVAEVLAPLVRGGGGSLILRSGCYVTHDCGIYDDLSPLGTKGTGELQPALEVWGAVISAPEPGLVLAGIGRRDASYDAGLPIPLRMHRDGVTTSLPAGPRVMALNDQHAYVEDPDGRLRVGDLLGLGISHPCTTFDKWRSLELVDAGYRIIGSIRTAF